MRRPCPSHIDDPVTMGEGARPSSSGVGGRARFFKLEWFAPTGSFKDRGAAVMISVLRQRRRHVLEDSSGNGGASIAAYAAAGGPARQDPRARLHPAGQDRPDARLRRGGRARAGTRQDVRTRRCGRRSIFYASHNWQPFFLQGTKTLAYELWEELGFQAPDNVVIPSGPAATCWAATRLRRARSARPDRAAASALRRAARRTARPSTPASQAGVDALVAGEMRPPWRKAPRSRTGAACARCWRRSGAPGAGPLRSRRRRSPRPVELARLGLYVEPTCATAAAAFLNLIGEGTINPAERTVYI